jgi:DNA-binding transcriptional LysR family regulator
MASGRRLDVFRTIIERGGVNAAADWLGVSQPSITAHLRALEREVGVSLFKRQRGRRNVVTPAGDALYQFACEAAAHRRELHGKLRDITQHQTNSLSLAVQRSIANYTMPRVLAAFLKLHPTARVSMHSEIQETVRDMAAKGTIDAAILFGGTPEGSHVIGHQALVLIAATSHPLARRKRVSVNELGTYAFVGGLRNSQFFALVEAAMRKAGVPDYNVILHLQDSVAVKNAVLQGIGIACTLASVVEQEVVSGRLAVLKTDAPLPALPIEVLLPDAGASALCQDFLKVWHSILQTPAL